MQRVWAIYTNKIDSDSAWLHCLWQLMKKTFPSSRLWMHSKYLSKADKQCKNDSSLCFCGMMLVESYIVWQFLFNHHAKKDVCKLPFGSGVDGRDTGLFSQINSSFWISHNTQKYTNTLALCWPVCLAKEATIKLPINQWNKNLILLSQKLWWHQY